MNKKATLCTSSIVMENLDYNIFKRSFSLIILFHPQTFNLKFCFEAYISNSHVATLSMKCIYANKKKHS